jgi:hypothetical protein
MHLEDYKNAGLVIDFQNSLERTKPFNNIFFEKIIIRQGERVFVPISYITDILSTLEIELKLPFKIDSDYLISEVDRLTKKFFQYSYVACFSEVNNNFLLWSHYASKHTGVCLEFTIEPYSKDLFRFPVEFSLSKPNSNFFEKGKYSERIRKVSYDSTRRFANFFEFLAVFLNEDEPDLVNLSKSIWHQFADKTEDIFCTKTEPWQYENEWRIVSIEFDKYKFPEKRIRKFPIKTLTAIYFGMRTPKEVKNRIYDIFRSRHKDLLYYDTTLKDGRKLEFKEWNKEEVE